MILLIDNYDSFTFNLYQMIVPLGAAVEVVRNDKITLSEIEAQAPAGIILSPGPGRPEDAGICMALIQHFTGAIPILGVCLGHQAIAASFGGRVIQSGEIVHGKPTRVVHTGKGLYEGMVEGFAAGRYHSLIVDEVSMPGCLQVEARNADGMIMGLRHRNAPTYGVQFHPESILTPSGPQLCANFVNDICEQAG